MKRKYFKRDTAVYKFKHEILTKDEYQDLNETQKETLWRVYLLTLLGIKKVSKYQANNWKYPKNQL